MLLTPLLGAYCLAAALLALTPGIDTALVLRTATVEGRRAAALAAFGVTLGCLVWGAAVALGLGAILTASALAFTTLKWAGAAYLLWLGVQLIWNPRLALDPKPGRAASRQWSRLPLARGLLTNLLNPKVGVFYLSFLPQFIPPDVDVRAYGFMLAAIHVALSLVWFAILIAATIPIGRFLARPRVVATLDRLTGCVFIVFGLRLALARRG